MPIGRPTCSIEENIRMYLREIGAKFMNRMDLARYQFNLRNLLTHNYNSDFNKPSN